MARDEDRKLVCPNSLPPEVKEMDRTNLLNLIGLEQGGKGREAGSAKLSCVIGVPQPTIWNYIQILYLPGEFRS